MSRLINPDTMTLDAALTERDPVVVMLPEGGEPLRQLAVSVRAYCGAQELDGGGLVAVFSRQPLTPHQVLRTVAHH